jgi:hypothetical protein
MTQEIAGGDQFEPGRLDLGPQGAFADAVIGLADIDAIFRQRRMVRDDQITTGVCMRASSFSDLPAFCA